MKGHKTRGANESDEGTGSNALYTHDAYSDQQQFNKVPET